MTARRTVLAVAVLSMSAASSITACLAPLHTGAEVDYLDETRTLVPADFAGFHVPEPIVRTVATDWEPLPDEELPGA